MLEKKIRQFHSLIGVDCNVYDVKLKTFENPQSVFCSKCPEPCDYKNTHLHGCYESVRWDNKYIYYCPMEFIFVAVPVTDEDKILTSGVIIGPVLMGATYDNPQTYTLPNMDTTKVNALAEIASTVFATPQMQGGKEKVGDFLNAVYKELEVLPKTSAYPIDVEKRLQTAIVSGDEKQAKEYLNRLLGEIFFHSNGDFNVIKARALELLVLLSRSAIEGGADVEQIFALNTGYIEEIDKFDTLEKLSVWLSSIINRFVHYVFGFKSVRHSVTIRKIVEYIHDNYMKKITLDDIADAVYMSKSHVSKIFNTEMHTSITAYINKIRVEKAKKLLRASTLSIAEIATLTGFEGQSYFAKQFKSSTGVSPNKFRETVNGKQKQEDGE
ncbi:MAG: helix-turn-helix domain-containing protein [Clostridiales bacterium]|nr:helix-turn-helix domain-containing protein [Clostridiales bacterium]